MKLKIVTLVRNHSHALGIIRSLKICREFVRGFRWPRKRDFPHDRSFGQRGRSPSDHPTRRPSQRPRPASIGALVDGALFLVLIDLVVGLDAIVSGASSTSVR